MWIALLYVVAGGLWIIFSDRLVGTLASDPSQLTALQTAKGWLYVGVTGALLWLVARMGGASGAEGRVTAYRPWSRRSSTAGSGPEAPHERNGAVAGDGPTERALWESEARFRQLADNIPQVFWMTSLEKDRIIYVSPAFDAIWGFPREDLAEDPRAWIEAIVPEDRERVVSAMADQASGGYDQEYRIRRPDGEERWIRDRAFPVRDERGGVYRVAGIAEDVTARRRREEELLLMASAIEQTGEGVMITDAGGTIRYVNPAFEEITGYGREEVLGRNPRFLNSGTHDGAFYREMWATLLAGRPWHARLVDRRKDGTLFTQDSIITPIRSGGGEITHFLDVFRDVSYEIRLQDQLRQAQKMQAVGRLAGGIAHDFNNVLTAVKGHAAFGLEAMEPGHPARVELEEVAMAADRAHNLTRQLLAFSRQQVVEPRVLELGPVVHGAESMLRRLIGEDVELEVRLDDGLGRILADPTQIEQVLVNLAVNARDAMPGGGRLRIAVEWVAGAELPESGATGLEQTDGGPGYVRIVVSDNGVGMDAETLDQIFEPFFTTKAEGEGTGLGLSTVYGIVKQMEGSIHVASEPGSGTRFEILVPGTAAAVEDREDGSPESREVGGSETVLLAEDQAGVRALARRALERGGYRVLEARSGADALAVWEEDGPVDLVVTDVVMPGMSGLELARRLREIRPELRVLFMSGYTGDELDRRGGGHEEMNLLEKPFYPGELLRRVRELLDRPRLTAQRR